MKTGLIRLVILFSRCSADCFIECQQLCNPLVYAKMHVEVHSFLRKKTTGLSLSRRKDTVNWTARASSGSIYVLENINATPITSMSIID